MKKPVKSKTSLGYVLFFRSTMEFCPNVFDTLVEAKEYAESDEYTTSDGVVDIYRATPILTSKRVDIVWGAFVKGKSK